MRTTFGSLSTFQKTLFVIVCAVGLSATALFDMTIFKGSETYAMAVCTDPAVSVPEAECEALVDLYNDTNGASWTNNTDWNTLGTDPCDWFGVTCSISSEVIVISLANNNLTGTLPTTLPDLTALTNFNITSTTSSSTPNSVGGVFPTGFGSMVHLTDFLIANNNIAGSFPSDIGNLTFLRTLDVTNNDITGTLPSSMGSMIRLINFFGAGNDFTGSLPSTIGGMVDLQRLYLNQNDLGGTLPSGLWTLSDLSHLRLSNNTGSGGGFSGTISNDIGNLTNAEEILLNGNQLTGTVPTNWSGLTSLRILDLGFNQLTGGIPTTLGTLSSLENLSLRGNTSLGGGIPVELGNISTLESLLIDGSGLTGTVPSVIGLLSNLSAFRAGDNSLSGDLPSFTATSLASLLIGSNDFAGKFPDSNIFPSSLSVLSMNDNNWEGALESGYTTLSVSNQLFMNGTNYICGENEPPAGTWIDSPVDDALCIDGVYCNTNADCQSGVCGDDPSDGNAFDVCLANTPEFACTDPAVTIPESECEALVQFFDNQGGSSWTNGSSGVGEWKAVGSDPCNWFGVTCANVGGNDHVEELTLVNNNISGNFVDSSLFGNLSFLKILDLNNNRTGGFGFGLPSSFSSLTGLEEINLSDNNFANSDAGTAFTLPLLEVLRIRNNKFSGTLPDFSTMTAMRIFDAGVDGGLLDNDFTGTIPTLSNSGSWTFFDISGNDFTGRFPTEIEVIAQYTSMSVSLEGNDFEGAFPGQYYINGSFPSGFTGNGDNYTCGSAAHQAANRGDSPYDSVNGSTLCTNNVFCNDATDCQSNNCVMDANLGYTTCQSLVNELYSCQANGAWSNSQGSCTTVDYDVNTVYTDASGAVCNSTQPASTTCNACGDNEVDNGETCDGSGQAQCSSGEVCNSCNCETTGNEYTCQGDGTWTVAGAACNPVDYNTSGTYVENQVACSDTVPSNTTCEETVTCDYCDTAADCGGGAGDVGGGTPMFCSSELGGSSVLFCNEGGLECPSSASVGDACGFSGQCQGACFSQGGRPPAFCTATPPVHGVCDTNSFMQDFYRPDAPNTNELCSSGTSSNFAYNMNSGWIWDCNGSNGGTTVSCSADETYCGDTTTQLADGEACDNGSTNGDGCDNTCQIESLPACTLTVDTETKDINSTWVLSVTKPDWATTVRIDYDDGTAEQTYNAGSVTTYDRNYSYTSVGSFNPIATVVHPFDGSEVSCTVLVQSDETGAQCGTDANTEFYSGSQPSTANACSQGSLDGIIQYDAVNHRWTWSCTSQFGSHNTNCIASETYCGDMIINGGEVCDGADLGGETCASQGFGAGNISCDTSCALDVSQCLASVDGSCGTAIGTTMTSGQYSSLTPSEYCTAGTYQSGSPNPNGNDWNWTCLGEYGGADSTTCTANLFIPAMCGTAAGEAFYPSELNDSNNPTLCDDGSPAPDLALSGGTFSWTCGTQSCEAVEKVDAVCSTTLVAPLGSVPTTDLCDAGSAGMVAETATHYTWMCSGLNGGTTDSSCQIERTPTCADLSGQVFVQAADITDTIGCTIGTIQAGVTDLGATFEWNCENSAFTSPTCTAQKDIPVLSCDGLHYQLVLPDLGYTRFTPYLEEDFTATWIDPVQEGVSITQATFNGVVINDGLGNHTTSIDTVGTVNYEFIIQNALNSEQETCTFPIAIEAYQHDKNVHAIAIDTTSNEYVVTYRIDSAMPEGIDIVTFSDRINTGLGEGFVDILINTIRILDSDGDDVSTNFGIIDSSIIAHTSDINGTMYTDGFDLAVQALTNNAYGNFVLEYEAVVLQQIDTDICNVCQINGNNAAGGGATTFIEKVFAQDYGQSDGVCIEPDPLDPTTPSCQACDYNAGFTPCPSGPNPTGGSNQSTTNVGSISQCNTVNFCGCYQNTPSQDSCAGSCASGFEECAGPAVGGGPNQNRTYETLACGDIANPSACSCGPTINCSQATLLPNTVACSPENPTQQNQSYQFDPNGVDFTTCGGVQACGMVCAPGATYDPTANGGTGGCLMNSCDDSTKVDVATLPAGATIVDCADSSTSVNQPFTFAADQNDCNTTTDECVYFIDCGFGQTRVGDALTGTCEAFLDIQKTGEQIQGSAGTFMIQATVGAVVAPYTITIDDSLVTNPNNDQYSSVLITAATGITGGTCTITGSSFTCTDFVVTDETAGGTITIEAVIDPLAEGGDDEICNAVSITLTDGNGTTELTDDDCISGYNLSIEKNVLTNYDSGNGNGAINTYPNNIALGDLYHGDWVVYEVIATNDGPQDAFSPVITDSLPTGLEIVDYLAGSTTSATATIDVVNWAVGAQTLELRMNGQYQPGDTTTLRFSARFDQNDAGAVTEICNDVEVRGENRNTEETSVNNSADACLNVPACGDRQCSGEIFGTDFVRQGPTTGYGTVTIEGICEIEGTCEMSGRIPTSQLELTYSQCSGTYATTQNPVSNIWTTIMYSDNKAATATFGTTQPTPAEIQAQIALFIDGAYVDGGFDLADETTLSPINTVTNGTYTFDCREGNPVVACAQPTCSDAHTLSQAWVLGGPDWTNIGDVLPPAEGAWAPNGTGFVDNFSCNTCDNQPEPPAEDFCPEGSSPISDINGNITCGGCLACGCCQNGADLTVEYEQVIINGQPGYDVVDIFCPDPVGSTPPYPTRSYDFYDGTDLDGDGKPDVCLQYDKSITSIVGNQINYDITGFLGGVPGSEITITDTLDIGGIYDNNFTITATQGAGTLDTTTVGNQTTLVVTKTSTESFSFIISYSVTGLFADGQAVCNIITFDDGGTIVTDEECACAENQSLCSTDNTCSPTVGTDTGCGYNKEIVSISGDTINYLLTGYIPAGQTTVEIVDTLDGATYANDFVLQDVSGSGTLGSTVNGQSASLTVTKTSPLNDVYSFTVAYSVNTGRSAQTDPLQVCNDVFFSDGATTVGTGQTCACPDTYTHCPVTNSCQPEGTSCGFVKEVVSVIGDAITYQVSGIVLPGTDDLVIADIVNTATYNDDFVLATQNGTGILNTQITGNAVTMTVTKTSALTDMMNFTITYTVTADRDTPTTQVCNDIVVSDNGTIVGTDSVCVCETGENCGYDKRLVSVVGNILTYEIDGMITETQPFIIITDTIENATFTNDFTYIPVSGTGELLATVTGQTAQLRVTKTGSATDVVTFTITYTTTASWTLDASTTELPQVCNEITLVPSSTPNDPIDEICACPTGFDLCPVNNMCILVGEPCGYDKRITDVTGNTISYEIDFLIPTGQQSVTIADFLDGATYDQASVVLTTAPINTASITNTFSGSTAEFLIAKTVPMADVIGGNVTYTATATNWAANPTNPPQVCNDVVFEDNGTFITLDSECTCPTNFEYCPATDACIPAGETCGSTSMCTELTVTPTLVPGAPVTPSYVCTGTGTASSIDVYDEFGTIVYTSTDMTGSFTLPNPGIYEAVCNYDGDTGLRCGSGPFSSAQLTLITNDVRSTLIAQGQYFDEISWTGYRGGLTDADYLQTGSVEIINRLQQDTYNYFISQVILLYPPVAPSTDPNIADIVALENTINQTVILSVNGRCSEERCVVPIDVGGGGVVCEGLFAFDPLSVRASNHSVSFDCVAELPQAGQLVELDCDNATSTTGSTILTGTTVDLGNGFFGFTGQCDYVRESGNALFSPTCSVAGVTNDQCTQDVILTRGSGGGGNSIVCGNGRIEGNEECDDGNNSSFDGCSSNCQLEDPYNPPSGGPKDPVPETPVEPCGPNDIIFPGFCVEEEPKCAYIDPPSVQMGEYLPFRWDLELGESVDPEAWSCGDILETKRIPGNSMQCTFEIYNGSSDEPVMTIPDVRCMDDRWVEDNLSLFYDFPFEDGFDPLGKSFLRMDKEILGDVYGEYQIVLSEVRYLACGEGGESAIREVYEGVSNNRICTMNFAVSDSYMIHKGSSLKTGIETDLGAFRQLNGMRILPETVVEKIATSQLSEYDSSVLIDKMRAFANQYIELAVSQTTDLSPWTPQAITKVVNNDVYLYDGTVSRRPLTIGLGSIQAGAPKTVIVKNADLIVEGSVAGNILWVVLDGTVTFKNVDCDSRDVVQGFYVTQEGFESVAVIDGEIQTKIANDDLGAYSWCEDGRLVIDGFLLGPGLDSPAFISSRRASLDQWFNIGYESQADKVFNGASLLFKTNTALRSFLPTGVSEFKDIIQAFK